MNGTITRKKERRLGKKKDNSEKLSKKESRFGNALLLKERRLGKKERQPAHVDNFSHRGKKYFFQKKDACDKRKTPVDIIIDDCRLSFEKKDNF